jgi:hypothetical protein
MTNEREKMSDKEQALQELLDAAETHGELSDAGMEVGDLQALLWACWGEMTDEQVARVLTYNFAEEWLGEDEDG